MKRWFNNEYTTRLLLSGLIVSIVLICVGMILTSFKGTIDIENISSSRFDAYMRCYYLGLKLESLGGKLWIVAVVGLLLRGMLRIVCKK